MDCQRGGEIKDEAGVASPLQEGYMPKNDWGKNILHSKTYKIIILCVWLTILGTCLLYRLR